MKRMGMVGTCAGLLLLAGAAAAAELSATKFGYVDFQRALNEVEEGRRARTQLKGEFDQKQRQLEAMEAELKGLQTDLEKQRLILSADALREKEEVYRKKVLDLTEKMNAYRAELQGKEVRMTGGILSSLKGIVREIGQKEGYTMILEKSQDVVLYSPTDADLTERVIKAYNALPKGKRGAE
ncbi:MAG: OmpH family outer membrane protein [Deltaproteobacteria bacterium]|nr:OmpH family outer membrane protein [Deltaproteobacteria bacterium]